VKVIGYRNGKPVYEIAGAANAGGIAASEHVRQEEGSSYATAQVPFVRASYQYREKLRTDAFTLSTSQQNATPLNIIPGGFMRGIWLEFQNTVVGALGTAVLGQPADFPFSLIASLTLEDVNGQAIVGPISGYQLYLLNKYGGYFFDGDPVAAPGFVGTFVNQNFYLWIPCEIRSDGLGSLANTDARAQYRLIYTVESQTNITSTGTITTQPQFTVSTWIDYWAQVEAQNMAGEPQEQVPPFLGTTQFWYREVPVVASGAQTIKHNRVGNSIRTIIYVFRAGNAVSASIPANVRAASSGSTTVGVPATDPVKVRLDNRYLWSESPNLRRKGIMDRQYLITGADGDPAAIGAPAVGILETGILVYPFSRDIGYHPGPGDEGNWLDTNEAQFLQFEASLTAGTNGVASMEIVTNDVAPAAPRG
jgi:hypothetical protein